LNFETVKYFNAEDREVEAYNKSLQSYFDYTEQSQWVAFALNAGQSLMIGSCVGINMCTA
jgi:ATP-binding cassette subfamily B protein